MAFGRSMISVLAAWVAWVYVLSLLVLLGVPKPVQPDGPANLRPNVRFVEAEKAFQCPPDAGRNALADVEVEISEPLDHDVAIPIKAIRGTARPAEHYEADPDAAAVIEAGDTRGRIRLRDEFRDVTVRPEGVGTDPLRFTLELQHTRDVVAAPDPLGRREIELLPGHVDEPTPTPGRLIAAGFGEPFVIVPEKDFPHHRFVVRADRPIDADADVQFELRRGIGDSATVVRSFRRVMRRGAADMAFSLVDVFPPDELRSAGLADDDVPGPDEYYELHVDPRPPLIAAGDPCFQAVLVTDDDAAAELTQVLEGPNGTRLRRITPGEPYFVVPELSWPLERDCHVVPIVDGRPRGPGGVIPAGQTRGPRFGPFVEDGDKEAVPVSMQGAAPANGLRRCGLCDGHGGDCPDCKAKGACKNCQGRPGGCEACKGGAGVCRGCGGRPGGCVACGFGKGTCSRCGGKGGDCSACGGKGPCSTCKGKPGACPDCDGKGTCGTCKGKGGNCPACGGKGACGTCKGGGGACPACHGSGCGGSGGGGSGDGGSGGGGSGGGGSGGGGSGGGGSGGGGSGGGGSGGGGSGGGGSGGGGSGGGGPVKPSTPRDVPVGPPVQGDFLLLLVNNQRLHEPGDRIAASVVEAIKDEKAYRDAAFVVNERDESELKAGGPPPDPSTTFRPFSREGEDLSGQVQRVVDTIAEKRDRAAKDRLPTVVIWPERELSSAADLAALAELAAQGGGPISVLCPDADPEKARRLAAALQPPQGAKDKVTVRSPKTPELVEHIRDVIHAGRSEAPPTQTPRKPQR